MNEVSTGGTATVLGDPLQGLVTGNFAVQISGLGNTQIVTLSGNAAFDNPGGSTAGPPTWRLFQDDLNTAITPTGTLVAPDTYRLYLGSVSLNAGNLVGQSNLIQLVDPDTLGDDLFLGNGLSIDSTVSFGNASVMTVAAVPEPATGALCLFLTAGAGVIKWSRRRRKAA